MKYLYLFIPIFFLLACTDSKSSIQVDRLQCEYLENPLGLDEKNPRFSWILKAKKSSEFGQAQTAYRILVSQNNQTIKKDEGDMWDSGWISSSDNQHIEYAGKELKSDRKYYWKVQVKDEQGELSAWSRPAYWSTGLFEQTDWQATWIGSDIAFEPVDGNCNIPDPWLRKNVSLDSKPKQAIMFVASIGFHELYVNGKKITENIMAPLVNEHTTRASYVAYDIAEHLRKGDNTIALWLGVGWSIFSQYVTGDRPRTPMVIAQADLYNESVMSADSKPYHSIATDGTWKAHSSPNKLLGTWETWNFGGEIWDANMEISDWNLPSYDDSSWKQATEYATKVILSAEKAEPNKVFDKITPVSISENTDGSFRVDMGVNFAGWTNIKVKGEPNQRIDFLFSEREQDEMTFRHRSAFIIDETGEGIFKNKFNYSSGRWITIKGLKEKPNLEDITGWLIRTSYEDAAEFNSSNDLQNWIYNTVCWTFENLSLGGFVVDCPQRERLGYGGDAHATSETGLLNYQMGAFYTKWMQDWRDVQGWESMGGPRVGGGILPHTAPTNIGGGGPSWGGICISLPWFIYQHYGDKRILEKNYELITNWLEFLDSHTKDDILRRYGGTWDFLGDWLWPNATAEGMNNDKPETVCLNSCYRVFNLKTAANIARVLGRTADADKWDEKAQASAKAIHAMFYDSEDFSYADKSMGNLAAALLADIPPAELKDKVIERLEKEILEIRNGHIHVGITGGALLFRYLRETGRDDLIYSMTSQTTYPSWGHMRENDATTIWEMWEKDLPGHSLLHSSYLYPGAWYIDGVAGIKRGKAGYKEFSICVPILKENQINWAKASFDSPMGVIKSHWTLENGKYDLKVTVPPNCKANIHFPSIGNIEEKSGIAKRISTEGRYTIFEVPAGSYHFTE